MVWLWLLCRPSVTPRLLLSVFGKSDVSRGRGRREKAEGKREGGKFLWTTRHGGPPESQVWRQESVSSPFLFLYLCLCALSFYSPHSPTLSFLECLFPVEHPIFNLLSTVSAPPFHYSALSTQPVPYSLSCFNRGRGGVVVGVCTREKTKPPNLGLSFTHEVSCCIRGASCRCRMSRHSKSLALRMWVIWSRGTKVRCLPVNGAFSRWHGEKRVNKHHRPGAALKCFGCILLSTPPIQACYYPAHEWISEPAFDMGIMLLLVKIPYQTLSFTSTAEEADSLPFFPLPFFELEENQIKA